ncbi:hypothetical protein NL676_000440 [Syzygium grande]|nr:hypothetical protein NL676_000440 [Syzygium grande]
MMFEIATITTKNGQDIFAQLVLQFRRRCRLSSSMRRVSFWRDIDMRSSMPSSFLALQSGVGHVRLLPQVLVDIEGIEFDKKKSLISPTHHPGGPNTEVIVRNLVASRAMAGSSSLTFVRYVELMNWLIDAAKDVELLRDGIEPIADRSVHRFQKCGISEVQPTKEIPFKWGKAGLTLEKISLDSMKSELVASYVFQEILGASGSNSELR